jgi:hypothetical protein
LIVLTGTTLVLHGLGLGQFIIPVTLGGTGVNNLTGLKTALALDKINNTTDQSKPISTLTQTALDLKLNAVDTIKYTKQTYTDSALLTKLSITGNAATATSATNATTAGTATSATKLATARSINGVSFDGSADITVNADAGTLTGTTLKSTVTGSSLTSVGTLANLTVTNPIAGSITGNAATATIADNISATTNTTLTMLSNLSTIGTITSGVWSGSIISIEKGGTGLNATGTNGQILTSTSSGTLTWTNFPGKHYIGEEYGGGIVFYTYDEGRHGLIAALNDVVPSGGGNVMAWSEGGNRIITRDGINAGIYNTEVINSKTNFPESYAAGKCKDYNANNLGDWYLPSKYELQLLSLQRYIIPGFSGGFYWSSTAYYEDGSNDKAWGIDFSGGRADKLSRTITNRARAIRSF